MVPLPTAQCRPSMTGTYITSMMKQPIAAYVFTLDGILMGAQDVKYLAIGCFIMLVMYVPVMLGLHWAVGAGAMDALTGYCGLWAAYILYFQGIRAVIFGRRAASDVWMKAGAE